MESVFAPSEPKKSLYESNGGTTLTIQIGQRFAGNSPCNLHASLASRFGRDCILYTKGLPLEGHRIPSQSNKVQWFTSASTITHTTTTRPPPKAFWKNCIWAICQLLHLSKPTFQNQRKWLLRRWLPMRSHYGGEYCPLDEVDMMIGWWSSNSPFFSTAFTAKRINEYFTFSSWFWIIVLIGWDFISLLC